MFQYAAGLALAHKHRTVQKLDVSWYQNLPNTQDHDRYGLTCFNICEQFATKNEIATFFGVSLGRRERLFYRGANHLGMKNILKEVYPTGVSYFQKTWDYDPGFWSLPQNTHLEGYFQDERYFAPIAPLIRYHFSFRFPQNKLVSEWAEKIKSSRPSVFIHFRRNDYVGQNAVYGALGLNYYSAALRKLKEKLPHFTAYVFSDDLDWVEKNFSLDMPHHFVRATDRFNFFDKIRLMSFCDHAILSNSTFAWWGAWLIENSDKIVITPEPWHADQQFKGLNPTPEKWSRISREPLAASL